MCAFALHTSFFSHRFVYGDKLRNSTRTILYWVYIFASCNYRYVQSL